MILGKLHDILIHEKILFWLCQSFRLIDINKTNWTSHCYWKISNNLVCFVKFVKIFRSGADAVCHYYSYFASYFVLINSFFMHYMVRLLMSFKLKMRGKHEAYSRKIRFAERLRFYKLILRNFICISRAVKNNTLIKDKVLPQCIIELQLDWTCKSIILLK